MLEKWLNKYFIKKLIGPKKNTPRLENKGTKFLSRMSFEGERVWDE